jgi:hypothetical protein
MQRMGTYSQVYTDAIDKGTLSSLSLQEIQDTEQHYTLRQLGQNGRIRREKQVIMWKWGLG